VVKHVFELLVLMLAPMAPHLAEELWEMLGHREGLRRALWPEFRPELAEEDQFVVVVQINGRLRGKILVDAGLGEDELAERALEDPRIAQITAGRRVLKKIVVPNKLVNLVVS
jgi:leucyl-tRNA synthetase